MPELVFLDEMTTGLDPASRRVAWDLIRRIRAAGTTVILVTHFMDEAENLCDRLAIIARGRVVASDTPDGLVAHHAPETLVTFSTDEADVSYLREVAGVDRVQHHGRRVSVSGYGAVLANVGAALVARDQAPTSLRAEKPSLEDVYLRIVDQHG